MPVFYTTAGESTKLNEIILLNTNTLTFLAIQSPFSQSHGESPGFNLLFSMLCLDLREPAMLCPKPDSFLERFFSHSWRLATRERLSNKQWGSDQTDSGRHDHWRCLAFRRANGHRRRIERHFDCLVVDFGSHWIWKEWMDMNQRTQSLDFGAIWI